MNCRLCDKNIIGKNGLLLFDYTENVETRLGRKINIILNSKEKYENLSNYCCNDCSFKIEICFSLLVEIQASDEVIRQTYENLTSGKNIDTASQLFICGECSTTVSGIQLFIKHYESHIIKKTTVGSVRDIKVQTIAPCDSKEKKLVDSNNFLNDEISILTNMYDIRQDSEGVNGTKVDSEETELMNNNNNYENEIIEEVNECDTLEYIDMDNNKDNNESDMYNENDDIDIDVDDSVYDLKPLSPDEFEDFKEVDLNSTVYISVNEFGELVKDGKNNVETIRDPFIDLDNVDLQSEDSFKSDRSYQNLVNIVKRELEKSDIEDESLDATPNENGTYSCETCNISFEYKFILKYHLEKNHEAFHDLDVAHIRNITSALENDYDPLLKCCYCKSTFSTSHIKEHIVECREEYSHNRKMLCQVCGKWFTFRELEKHLKDHSKIVWVCELCGKKFKAKRFLKSHLGEHDESKKKVCEICGKKLLPLSFFSHVMKHREKRHVCENCGKSFSYKYGLRMHMRIHDKKKVQPSSDERKNKVICWFCRKAFNCVFTLNDHLKNVHNDDSLERDTRFPCAQCGKKFSDMFTLKAHLKLIHEMKDEDIARLKSLPVYRFIECNVCYKVFTSENKVRIHMKVDHGLKPFEMEILKKECEKCGKRFASKQNLIHHINATHLNLKPMQCDVCQEKFAKHSSLIYHKLRHSGEKPFQCEFCKKSYRQRNDVIRHLARHVRDKELPLEEASAVNNSPSPLVVKRRIFLKDSTINYKKIKRCRKKPKNVKLGPIVEEETKEVQEEQMEFNENGMSDSMLYVEEIPVNENEVDGSSDMSYISAKPIFDEERNTIILSNPDVIRNSNKNITGKHVPSMLKHSPAVIVKKQEQI